MSSKKRIISLAILFLAACQSPTSKEAMPAPAATAIVPVDSTKHYNIALVNNKKDPACGMPVTAGISDTAHYKDKVLGFCSTECKDSFKKNPDAMIASAEIK
jgi:YHS domain-containing protein